MNALSTKIKASDIVFPPDAVPAVADAPTVVVKFDLDAVLHEIWHALRLSGTPNRNEQLIVATKALIAAGVDTQPRIIGAAMRLGFQRGHAGSVLSRGGSGAWSRDADGTYRLTPDAG